MPGPRIEGRQLLDRLASRRVVHPGEVRQLIAKGRAQIADQLAHLTVALGRVVARDIDLADRLAEHRVDQPHAALPARTLLGDVVQGLRIEFELGVIEGLGQILRVIADEVESEIVLPRRKRRRIDQFGGVLYRRGLSHDDVRQRRESRGLEEARPVELRHQSL